MENIEDENLKNLLHDLKEVVKEVKVDEELTEAIAERTKHNVEKAEEIAEEIEKIEEKERHHEPKSVRLIFIINGTPKELVEKEDEILRNAVQNALKVTGNGARPIGDWNVKYKDQELDLEKKIKEFDFPEGAELFISLKAGKGGSN